MRLVVKKIVISLILVAMLGCSFGCSRGNRRQTNTAAVYNRAIIITNEEIEIQIINYYIGATFTVLWSTDGRLYAVPDSRVVLISDEGER